MKKDYPVAGENDVFQDAIIDDRAKLEYMLFIK
jgi:hypothetical protein